ncbi:uncharacterized protein LOC131657833 [Vicia villosa]|uniref:uncharacterized protein LOC131657833 n=1 Tax=Vicia villosa TaxID=3911 RepID=UPI00273C298C|nr:uncharacterized protein LOC131657833 [Vicia villosa]
MPPFKALYDRDPPNLTDFLTDSSRLDPLGFSLQQHTNLLVKLKMNLRKSRQAMEKQANKTRIAYSFQPGDSVLLKLQPYRQTTVQKRSSKKLTKRFFGPFKVIKRVGEVSYLLDLPSSSHIHPVVHVSLLRPYFGSEPESDFCPLPLNRPLEFLDSISEEADLTTISSSLCGPAKELTNSHDSASQKPNRGIKDSVPNSPSGQGS